MKKLLLLSALLIFACSSDDSSSPTDESSDKISKIVLKSVSSNQSECDEQLVEFYGSEIEHNYIYSNNIATTLNYSAESYSCQTNDLVERNVFSLLQSQLENFYNSFQYENGYLTSYNLGGDTVSDYEIYEWSEGNLSRHYDSSNCQDPSNCHYYEIHYSEQINHTKYEFGFFGRVTLMVLT